MTQSLSGGCACGAVRYKATGEPVDANHCQCRQCQRNSGTGHASHVVLANAEVTVTGDPSRWIATGDMGTRKSRAFCPTCGAPVFMTFPDIPNLFAAFPGGLDDPAGFTPERVLWTSAAQPWDRVDPSLPAFATMPAA